MSWPFFLLFLAFGALAEVSSLEELKPIERAHVEVSHIKQNFRKTLEEKVAAEGAAQSVDGCKIDVSEIMASGKGKFEVGRTSHKLRNPSNAPRPWVQPLIQKWLKMKPAEMPRHELIELGPNHWGYVEPIFVEPICLNCHGAKLEPSVRKALKAGYPGDKATGFEVGELRGLFWLEKKP